jgi:phosphoesterase RecJ-like protein
MKPAINRSDLAGLRTVLARHDRFVVAFHRHPDGDALASAFLLCRMLGAKGKTPLIAARDPLPRPLAFFAERFPRIASSSYLAVPPPGPLAGALPEEFRGAPLIVIDSSNPGRTGWSDADLGLFHRIVNIDHHADNSRFGAVNCVDPRATSIGEILSGLFRPLGIRPDAEMSELVYISLYADTVGFSQDNVSPAAREIFAGLVRDGADLPGLNRLLRKRSSDYLRLSGLVFGRLRKDDGADPVVLWSVCTLDDMNRTGLGYEDLDGVIDEISFTGEAGVVFLLKELRPSEFKASIRSSGAVNVKAVASSFGGGGHDKASGFEIKGPADECAKRVIAAIRRG